MAMTAILTQPQRTILRREIAAARREVAHVNRHEAFATTPERLRFMEAKELHAQLAVQFASFALTGESDTADYVLALLRVADRYLSLCTWAYLGDRKSVAS